MVHSSLIKIFDNTGLSAIIIFNHSMDSTSNNAVYWVLGVVIVLAVLLGAWLWLGSGEIGIPNTGNDTNAQQMNTTL